MKNVDCTITVRKRETTKNVHKIDSKYMFCSYSHTQKLQSSFLWL